MDPQYIMDSSDVLQKYPGINNYFSCDTRLTVFCQETGAITKMNHH